LVTWEKTTIELPDQLYRKSCPLLLSVAGKKGPELNGCMAIRFATPSEPTASDPPDPAKNPRELPEIVSWMMAALLQSQAGLDAASWGEKGQGEIAPGVEDEAPAKPTN